MNFLTPLFLLGGLALAVPVIYHLVRRTTRERTRFSSLMFLLPSPPRLSKRHRLEHLLLLLLRCAALALLVLGFARPFLEQPPVEDPNSGQPKRTVVLLDASASLRREGAWAAAVARAGEVVRRAGPADQLALFTFDRKATAVLTFEEWNRAAPGDRAAMAAGRLAALAPTWGGTHLGTALVTAAEALAEDDGKAAPGPRQVVLISDLQAGSRLDGLQAYEWPKGVELRVEAVAAGSPTNAGLQLVADAPEAVRAADAPVRVRVTNAPEARREQFRLGWVKAGGAATGTPEWATDPVEAYVPPGQSRTLLLAQPPAGTGATEIRLTGDEESFDNSLFFLPPTQQRPTVLWMGGEAPTDARQPLFFLRRALAETSRVAVQVIHRTPQAGFAPAELSAAGLVLVAGAIPTETAAALRALAESGKTIVFLPRRGEAAEGATLGVLLGRGPVALSEVRPTSYAMLSEIDFQHPLFAPFADPRYSDFTKIHVWKYRKVAMPELGGGRALAKFDSGDPALVEVPIGKGRVHVLTTGWQPEDSQLAVSSKFVPLLWSWLESSGAVGTLPTQFVIGDAVPVPPDLGATAVRGPDGGEVALTPGAAEVSGTLRPGVYDVTGGARRVRFAVNLDPSESRTTPLGLDELEQLGVPVTRAEAKPVAAPGQKTLLQGIEAENRQKLWRWFILATLAVLLVESAIAGWTARREAGATGEMTSP